jgi:putative peptidoglycan lipid II flippase
MVGTLLENAFSFVKSLFIAAYYGTSAELDAYFLSLAPLLLISGILGGVIQATLIPKYIEIQIQRGKTYAFAVFVTFTLWIVLFITIIVITFLTGSSLIASYLGTGFAPLQLHLLSSLLKISMFLFVFTILNDIGFCLFNAHRQFTFPAFIPLVNGILSLGYIVYFREQGIFSLMWGLVLGMLVQAGITFYAIRRFFPERPFLLSLFNTDVRKTITLMFPLLLGASFGHINVVIDQMMASTLAAGSIAALHYATRLHSIATQLFIIVVSRAVLPFFSQQVATKDFEALKETYYLTIKRMLYVLVPLSVGIIFLGKPLVQFVFQRGAFSAHSTAATAGAWIAYTIGLPIQAIGILTAKIYNVLQKNTILMYVAGASIGLNIFFNWTFMKIWGHIGIALSTSGVYFVTTGVLLYILHQKLWKIQIDAHSDEKHHTFRD